VSNRLRTALLVAAFLISAAVSFAFAERAEAQSIEYGCETYGCLYGHNPTHYSRGHNPDEWPKYATSYQYLPDGPDGRYFVEVHWPGSYDPANRAKWDQVAQCESTQRWHINTGNGYYGGIQFSLSTWHAFGGQMYAYYPHHATPEQQIDIGINVAYEGYDRYRPQGPGAWPHCGRPLR